MRDIRLNETWFKCCTAFPLKGFKSTGRYLVHITKCIYFSSQHENYTYFANPRHHMSGFQLAEWFFFNTSHGKCPCDGIGETVKGVVANSSLWSIKEPIDTPEKMFLWSKSNIKGVWLLCVFQSDVENRVSELKLEERSESLSTVPSTRATTCIFAQVYLLLRCEESLLML